MMQGANTTESYSYDPVGNRLSSLGVPSYTVNTSNELTGTSNASYGYDSNGNETSKTDSTGTTTYAWDFENRLTQVTLPCQGGTVQFKYDPFGRRIEKIAPSGTTIFAYDGDNVVETTNQNGGILSRFAQGQNIDEPLAESNSGTTSYYEADGLGSVTSLTAANGSVAQTYTYDSFGNTTHSTGSLTNPFQYTAREFDSETGLYYYRARYYDLTVGRFTTEDPMGFGAGINFYRYAGNNPLLWRDPDGRGPDWGSLYNSFSNAASKIAWINCFVKLGYCNPTQTRTFNDMSTEQELNTAIAIQQRGGQVSFASNLDLSQGCNQDKNCIQGIEACVQQTPVAGPASPPAWWSWVLGKLK